MKKILILFFILPNLVLSQTNSLSKRYKKINWYQYDLNTPKKPIWRRLIVPTVLIGAGLSINSYPTKLNIQNQLRKPFNDFTTKAEDYLQYAPLAILWGADLLKFKAEHSIFNQKKNLIISEVITGAIVFGLKFTTHIQRPDSSNFHSFPSGHTAHSFVGAQALYFEFKNTNPLIAYSGFAFAFATGGLRIVNNKHWLPDVLVGAGTALLVTNIVYHYDPFKNWHPLHKYINANRTQLFNLDFHPIVSFNYVGANLKLTL
jgi:membrane-associated phospholipid phosphatase